MRAGRLMEKHELETTMDFESFRRDNRRKVNRTLNQTLWFCILTGPAIALGIMCGVFRQTSYLACAIVTVAVALVAGGDSLILKKLPYSYVPSVIALVALDFLLCYMSFAHISIRLTWFVVPLLSLLLLDSWAYIGVSFLNYLIMALGMWMEAMYIVELRTDFKTTLEGFINIFSGCTIEAAVMFLVGLMLSKATNNYYRKMISQYAEAEVQKRTLQENLGILDSMAEIYDYVNLINFTESTEMSLREEVLRKLPIVPGQDHTHMTQGLRAHITADMVDAFWRFTDITTVPERLINRKSISDEFISSRNGWFRAQYIRVQGEMDRKPDVVIYTIQNIDADKRREEHLIRISRTDELTGMFNRHCYEVDVAELQESGIDRELTVISADVNGLKLVNDSMGHAAGDELICGAAYCLLSALGNRGKVYRTGGDEFMAIVYASDCEALLREIQDNVSSWKGKIVDSVSISVGCATHAEFPSGSIEELERIADARMYEDKERFYRQNGRERRMFNPNIIPKK